MAHLTIVQAHLETVYTKGYDHAEPFLDSMLALARDTQTVEAPVPESFTPFEILKSTVMALQGDVKGLTTAMKAMDKNMGNICSSVQKDLQLTRSDNQKMVREMAALRKDLDERKKADEAQVTAAKNARSATPQPPVKRSFSTAFGKKC